MNNREIDNEARPLALEDSDTFGSDSWRTKIQRLIAHIETLMSDQAEADNRPYAQGVADGLSRVIKSASFEAQVGRGFQNDAEARSYTHGLIDGLEHAAGVSDVAYKFVDEER